MKIIHGVLIICLLSSCVYRRPDSNEGGLPLHSIVAPWLDYSIDEGNKEYRIKHALETGNVLPDGTPCAGPKMDQTISGGRKRQVCVGLDGSWHGWPIPYGKESQDQ